MRHCTSVPRKGVSAEIATSARVRHESRRWERLCTHGATEAGRDRNELKAGRSPTDCRHRLLLAQVYVADTSSPVAWGH